jgi:acetyltransferase-like isoleucine patch superfamily enzyme
MPANLLESLTMRIVRGIRPGSAEETSTRASVLVGWYMRKGLVSGLRGLASLWRFRQVRMPVFIGRNVSINYARSVTLGRSCYLGANLSILAFSREGVIVGDRVTIRENGWIQCSSNPSNPGQGLVIGSDTYIGPSVTIGVGGPIKIGTGCQVGANCTLIAENHSTGSDGMPSATGVERVGIELGDGCWIGHGATIVDGVTLGKGCVVGAGAVVTKSFPARSRIAGVPARAIS